MLDADSSDKQVEEGANAAAGEEAEGGAHAAPDARGSSDRHGDTTESSGGAAAAGEGGGDDDDDARTATSPALLPAPTPTRQPTGMRTSNAALRRQFRRFAVSLLSPMSRGRLSVTCAC